MSDIELFDFKGSEIRVVMIDGDPWFIAKDVVQVFEYATTAKLLQMVDDEDCMEINPQKLDCTKMVSSFTSNTFRLSLINESGLYAVIFGSTKPEAKAFKKWVTSEVLPSIRKTGKYEIKQLAIEPVTNETIKVHIDALQYLTDNGDLQLASLLKTRFGNLLLAEQQKNLLGESVSYNLEGVVDVAIRLGFDIPKNLESNLGKFVKKRCVDLVQGQNIRYSSSSQKTVPANMYPANNPEVENAVLDFATQHKLIRRTVNQATGKFLQGISDRLVR
jgi:prophage antirepressor-like protein